MPTSDVPPSPPASGDPPVVPRWWTRRRVRVRDDSMTPTLRPGDRLYVDGSAYRNRPPGIGDVVVLRDPAAPARWLVKRVAARGPGRFWRTPDGLEPRAAAGADALRPPGAIESVDLADGTVYVLGDARGIARDSRHFGPVRLDALVGQAYRCYHPPERRRAL